ncbi:alpha-ketoacid dehydrogenase subunit beta [Ferviditalea candida]|uniref:Alpha-ketoacid dehydrogenase subunit beta n=1 Tax=Ferviditalea candida TaxID=3108399 RepID=A0ABU5ZNG8_9BACL|nr:alpha-ketoacid dehydrogenase subunit beta [Paenibacillaceae bacterium T2]
MQEMTMIQAINNALRNALESDPGVLIFGEDVGHNGGVFRATDGLQQQFGEERVFDTPLAESGIVGTAIGMAVNGLKPIAEIQFMGFIYSAFEQIISHAARIRTRSQGSYTVPMVIRAPYGAGIRAPELHSDSSEAFFVHQPGLKVVVPSNPYDAKGLLLAAIEDPDPVLFLEPMKLYRAFKEPVPTEKYTVPLGKAKVMKEGTDISIFSWGAMLPAVRQAVQKAEQEMHIQAQIIDLRTLSPLDEETIIASVQKTGRAVVVHEAPKTAGVGSEIIAIINDKALFHLEAPVARIAGYDVPPPLFQLEDLYIPDADTIRAGIERTMKY